MIPQKKISLTLLEFAEPFIDDLPEGYSKSDLEALLRFATVAWNACVIDGWQRGTSNVDAVRAHFRQHGNPIQILAMEALIHRKQTEFRDDPRAITNECVVVKDGGCVVRAEARLDIRDLPTDGRPM